MNRTKLLKAFEALNLAVSAKPLTEEMGCYRIAGKTMRASDGIMLVQVELEEDTGLDVTVPAPNLFGLLKGLSVEDVALVVENGKLAVRTDRTVGRFALASGPGVLDSLDFAVDAWRDCPEGLKAGVAAVRLSASRDASRPVYCGVLVKGDSVLASDSIRIDAFKAKEVLNEEAVVLSADAAALLAKRAVEVKRWAVKGGTTYFKTDSVVFGCRNVVGEYTAKVWPFLEKADGLGSRVEFPEVSRNILKRHTDQQGSILEMDREVDVALASRTLTVRSTDGVRYELEETAELAGDAPAFRFKVHPQCLYDILGQTKQMRYADSEFFVAFVMDLPTGQRRYLTTVERAKA